MSNLAGGIQLAVQSEPVAAAGDVRPWPGMRMLSRCGGPPVGNRGVGLTSRLLGWFVPAGAALTLENMITVLTGASVVEHFVDARSGSATRAAPIVGCSVVRQKGTRSRRGVMKSVNRWPGGTPVGCLVGPLALSDVSSAGHSSRMSPVRTRSFSVTNDVANLVLIPMLRSRAGRRLGRRLAVVEYLGRRSGQPHQLITQYAVDGRMVRIRVGMARHKSWWRNFQSGHPVRLRLDGKIYDATAHVERNGDRVSVVAELPPT